MISLAGTAVMAALVVLQPAPEIAAGATFIAMAFFLGIGTGGVFAWVALSSPPDRVGAVTGIVGAAGGLGGFFPPLVMGATYDSADNNYTTRTRSAQPGQPAGPAVHRLATARPITGTGEEPDHHVRRPVSQRKQNR